MSFLLGPVSGALVAGGVYYGFSNLIQARTRQLSTDLHIQSTLLLHSSTPAWIDTYPSPAASRIATRPFVSMVQASWNEQLEKAFVWVGEADKHVGTVVGEVGEWVGRKMGGKE
ncbi:hypothetical protein BT96DRAFT_939199 [Gymnopus androsaceus JB14]|uniref:MICOS complex subunit MIC12 n=1 Tax=Gymnopus androsaceus JB14 TaxID=1447944 RepID=A0A6A4HNV4_9AGAR|nr:hypothetical protein BT96DRAFT_939199 [Gymnopus androsaceus JB14]